MSSTPITSLLRGAKFTLDPLSDNIQPGSPLRFARALDVESLIGRHEGRARKGGAASTMSASLYKRMGPTRRTVERLMRPRPPYDPRQRATVKIHYFGHGGGGGAALRAHARYISRDAAQVSRLESGVAEASAPDRGDDKRAAVRDVFYDATQDGVDGGDRVARWAAADRRHFRIILAPENGAHLGDLRAYTRTVMARVEVALGTRLEWIAADHWDTGSPHTHIVVRGRRDDDRDLIMPRAFVQHGFRNIARDSATERLGLRTRADSRRALQNEILAHRPTRLDPMIAAQLDKGGSVRLAALRARSGGPDLSEALKSRARELARMGLAREVARNVLTFDPDWSERLKAMELHLDIRKTLMQTRAQGRARAMAKGLRLTLGPDI